MFALGHDAGLLPIVRQSDALVREWDLAAGREYITTAERELGGRFIDEAVTQLALACAIQTQRIRAGQLLPGDDEMLRWAGMLPMLPSIADGAARMWPTLPADAREAEAAALALHLLSGARDEPWREDLGADSAFRALIDRLLLQIATAFGVPALARDRLLRDGLEAHVLPACVRQRFGIWAPPKAASDQQIEQYIAERTVATQLARMIQETADIALPPDAADDLVLLLRAAIVRARPVRLRRVLVVCPSGMATTQLLVARLKARFPRLGTFEVMPMRELTTARIVEADLIVSTVPLALPANLPVDVIQVHPMLKPEDIVALTQWLS
jgi:mannitol operon transcriptional antiterminator